MFVWLRTLIQGSFIVPCYTVAQSSEMSGNLFPVDPKDTPSSWQAIEDGI